MKLVLASDRAPTAKDLLNVGWDDSDYKQGCYAKLLVPTDPDSTAERALYMGSATAVGGKGPNEFGLKARRAHHGRAWRTRQVTGSGTT